MTLPPHAPGLRIGLLGGSFNPPHAGHRHISLIALRRMELDAVWWLVSPGNPLKDNSALPPLATRMAWARDVAHHPRIHVSGIEEKLGNRYSLDTVKALQQLCPGVHFVWLMGADNLVHFDRWRGWRELAERIPIAVIDRPGALNATHGRAAQALARYRLPEHRAKNLALTPIPAWIFLHGPLSPLSSTALRNQRRP